MVGKTIHSDDSEWDVGVDSPVKIPGSCIKSSIVTEGVIGHPSRAVSRSPPRESSPPRGAAMVPRSITTITKYPQAKSTAGSGRRTATTKLNYGQNHYIASSDKHSKEDVDSNSATAQRKVNKTSHSNMTISSLMKSMADKSNLRQSANLAPRTKPAQLSQRQNQAKGESLETIKKSGGGTAQKSNKASSSRTHKGKSSPAKANATASAVVTHHARSFAMTSSKQQVTGVFTKQAPKADSASRQR